MRKNIITIIPVIGLLLPVVSLAQGTVNVSNLGEAQTGSVSIGSDSWIAQHFYIFATDPNTYTLNSIQLLMNPASGSPAGFNVSVYSSLNPVINIGTLSGPDPSAGGIFTYTASGITLSPGVDYLVIHGL